MWTVVYLAQNINDANRIHQALENEGFLVKVREINKNKNGQGTYEIMVPSSEAEDVNNFLPTLLTW